MNIESIINLMLSGLPFMNVSITYSKDNVAFAWQYACHDRQCEEGQHLFYLYVDKKLVEDETTGGWLTVINEIKAAKKELEEHLAIEASENVTYLH